MDGISKADEPEKIKPFSSKVVDKEQGIKKQRYIIFSDPDGWDAHVMLEVCYKEEKETVSVLNTKISGYSLSGRPVKVYPPHDGTMPTYEKDGMEKTPGLTLVYDVRGKKITGRYFGILVFEEATGKKHKALVTRNFTLDCTDEREGAGPASKRMDDVGSISPVTNFFEYGKQVENADDNYLNLQQNFEKYCDNAEIIRFVSWKKTGTVRRAAQLKKLMKKNVAMTPPYTLAASVRREGENTQSSIRLERISPMPDRKMIKNLLPQEIDASPYMNHDIYELSFTVNNEFFRQYYVVNRDTHHVVHFFTNIFDSDIKTDVLMHK